MKKTIIFLFALVAPLLVTAQQSDNLAALYEQASETSGLVVQYTQDTRNINYIYGVPSAGFGFQGSSFFNSPEQAERLSKLNQEYLQKLATLDFDKMSIHGQVDYILLRRKVEESQNVIKSEAKEYAAIKKFVPFDETIYSLERLRRRGAAVDGKALAVQLDQVSKDLEKVKNTVEKLKSIDQNQSRTAVAVVGGLKARLKSFFDFYNGYDPLFTWWVPAPYKTLDEQLGGLSKTLAAKSDAKPFDDGSNIGGQPIGREEFNRLLKAEMIDYTPEELIKLGDQEYEWCMSELLKASREMGFGDDWRAAQEKVKNSYVEAGKQPELIIKLYNDAQKFITEKGLMDMPPLSHETWGMQMMTPERQLMSPFFLGGRDILIAYPTNTMDHEHKLMSMRGNNPYFSRGTVQHELVPGHHLQYFMNARYKPYRNDAFRTPFWSEGWALYWELLLYKQGFAQTPEEKIGMLFWRMHRSARITFSVKYHLGEWTPQQCVDYLVDKVGHERSTAHAEVKRSFEGSYGPLYQLAYLVGGLQIFSLQQELVESGKMTHKEFHDRVMKENQMPIEMLRATLTNQKLTRDFKPNWKFYNFKK